MKNNKRLNSIEKLEQRILHHINNEDYFKTINRIFARLIIRLKEEKKPLKVFLEEVNNKHNTTITIQNLYDTVNRIKPLDCESVYFLHKEVLKLTFSSEMLDLCTQLNVDLDVIYDDIIGRYFYRSDSLAWNVVVKPLEKCPFCLDSDGVRINYNFVDNKGRLFNDVETYNANLLSGTYLKKILGIEKEPIGFRFSIDDYYSNSNWNDLDAKTIGSFIFDLKKTLRDEFKPIVNELKDVKNIYFHVLKDGCEPYQLYLTDNLWDIRDVLNDSKDDPKYKTKIFHKTIF